MRRFFFFALASSALVFPACGSEDGVSIDPDGPPGSAGKAQGGARGGTGGKGGNAGDRAAGGGPGSTKSGSAGIGGGGPRGGASPAGSSGSAGTSAGEGGSPAGGQPGTGPGGASGTAGASAVGTGGTSGKGGAATGGAAGKPGEGGAAGAPEVVIAAAGDISNTSIGGQKVTADLILAGKYDAVLTLGDNQYNDGTLAAYDQYFDATWGKFIGKIYPVAGNHEYNTSGAKGYFDYFGARAGDPKKGYYSFDLGAWHLIALSSNSECGAIPCKAGSEQEKWLRADLAANKDKKCTLAYWHHPRWSSGEHGNSTEVGAFWKALHDLDADVVLNGHDHDYERFAPQNPAGEADPANGIVEFVVGTGGTGFRDMPNTPAHSVAKQHDTFGVLKLVLKEDSYAFEFVGEPGSKYEDKGTGKCH